MLPVRFYTNTLFARQMKPQSNLQRYKQWDHQLLIFLIFVAMNQQVLNRQQ